MTPYPPLSPLSNRIIHFLNNLTSHHHIHQIQSQLILQNLQSNTTIASHFITASQSLGLLNTAHRLFLFQLHNPHIFICNTLIRALSHTKTQQSSYSIYTHMHKNSIPPNNYTFPFLLKSLADFKELKNGKTIHTHIVKLGFVRDIYVGNSLLTLYAGCGYMRLSRKLFEEMPDRDVVSWTVLITGYRNAESYDEALIAFEQMQYSGVVPNRVTMVNALAACANFGATEMGVWIHDFIKRTEWELDVVLGTSLITMYGKCGRIEDGIRVFSTMSEKNVFTWNAVIKGLALAKNGEEAVSWLYRMEEEGFKPDKVTLVEVLSACSYSGLVDIGRVIFNSLVDGKYGFSANVKHYACLVDLLARSGCLEDAFRVVETLPFEPTKSMWGSLLVGCRSHGNLEWSEFAAKKLVELEPGNSGYYVMLSNLYAEMGRWSDVEKVRELMNERGLKKDLGVSSMEPREPPERTFIR